MESTRHDTEFFSRPFPPNNRCSSLFTAARQRHGQSPAHRQSSGSSKAVVAVCPSIPHPQWDGRSLGGGKHPFCDVTLCCFISCRWLYSFDFVPAFFVLELDFFWLFFYYHFTVSFLTHCWSIISRGVSSFWDVKQPNTSLIKFINWKDRHKMSSFLCSAGKGMKNKWMVMPSRWKSRVEEAKNCLSQEA